MIVANVDGCFGVRSQHLLTSAPLTSFCGARTYATMFVPERFMQLFIAQRRTTLGGPLLVLTFLVTYRSELDQGQSKALNFLLLLVEGRPTETPEDCDLST